MRVDTGEVFDYNISEQKVDNTISIKNSLNRLRKLIQSNFINFESFFVTLTYAEEMHDFDKAVDDFRKFYDNLKYHYKHYRLEYIRIIEPTEKGVWHIHLLLKSALDEEKFIIRQEDIQALWKYGSAKVEQIYNINGLANYFCTCHSEKSMKNMRKSKSKEKQARWKYYPLGARIYTKSKGIVYPSIIDTIRGNADRFLSGYIDNGKSSYKLANVEGDNIINRVNYEHFRKE